MITPYLLATSTCGQTAATHQKYFLAKILAFHSSLLLQPNNMKRCKKAKDITIRSMFASKLAGQLKALLRSNAAH
jgi:hypothetical protein